MIDVAAARRAVHALDIAFTRVLRTNQSALAEWRGAKQVTLPGSRGQVAAVTPTDTPATEAA